MEEIKLTTTVMHHLFLWVYNWTEEDFKIAFKTSHLGWQYQWDKFQGNLSGDKCSSAAIIETVLNMDDLHQELILDFIVNKKYSKSIISMDKNKAWMNSVEFDDLKEKSK